MGADSEDIISIPDFNSVDPSILGLSNPELATTQGEVNPDNLYPSQWSNKTWGQQMIFHTGTSYILGTFSGGALGLYEGIKAGKNLDNRALKINSIINKLSRRGSAGGNAFGIIAIMYTTYGSILSSYAYKHESWHQVAAAGLTGLTYKCSAGPRTAAVAGILGVGLSGVYSFVGSQGLSPTKVLPSFL